MLRMKLSYTVFALSSAVFGSGEVQAQSFVYRDVYDCVRATNGLPYCKKVGAAANNIYTRVAEDFFAQYEAARLNQSSPPPRMQPAPNIVPEANQVTTTTTQVAASTQQSQTSSSVVVLTNEIASLKGEIVLLDLILAQQKKFLVTDVTGVFQETVGVIEDRVAEIRSLLREKGKRLPNYVTPIKPDDGELYITARKASETYTKVPYYIPGTKETGDFWIEPTVTDQGKLLFRFKFVDVNSSAAEKVRAVIDMNNEDLERVQKSLIKVGANSKLAHEKKIRRKLDVRIDCFPASECPEEGKKIDGKSSTEILFSINEDASTSGRIQRNKGRFEEGYNFSVRSGLLLQAYINYVLTEGKFEFEAGSASTEDLKNLFR